MRKGISFFVWFFLVFVLSAPCSALDRPYRVEILQVTSIEPYQAAYTGFIQELNKNGLVIGKNLQVRRTIIDFDVDKAGLWSKIGVLMKINGETQKIIDRKPDLVLTIGTPSTRYAKDKLIKEGIPVVFTGVAIPTAAGCKSQTESGPGFTGATLYMDMNNVVKILRLAFPKIRTLGVIHSEDENAVEQVAQLKKSAPSVGMNVISRLIDKNAHISPVAEELMKQGIEATIIPLDTYYGMRNYEATNELREMNNKWKKPGICLVYWKSPGAVLYVGADFRYIGSLSGQQAAKILLQGAKPESLPVIRQEDIGIMVDIKEMKLLGIELPLQILQIAKSVE